jgi:hypothetical protein
MNRFFALTVVLLSCWLCSGKLFAAASEVEKARRHGAQGQVTFRVVDSTGNPVAKAEIRATFPHSDAYGDVEVSKGLADTNGIFIAAGRANDQIIYDVKKEGSYKAEGTYRFYRRGENCVLDGRWQPWNPTITVVLKEHRNPIAMYAKRVDAPVPVRDTPVGFDLEVGDWVAPHGAGKQGDVYFTYKAKAQDFWTGSYELTLACSNKMDGFVRMRKDMWSEFLSAYEAPNDGYVTNVILSLDRTKDKILKEDLFGVEEYLTFRVRTILNDKGNVVSARHGKIYGSIEFGVGKEHNVRFTYYLNPTDNDRNVEFDPSQNLFAWRHDARERPYMP